MKRAVILAVPVLCSVVLLACPPTGGCNAKSCSGCCTAQGVCETGQSANACGQSGQQCTTCGSGMSCRDATCKATNGSGGGTAQGTQSLTGGSRLKVVSAKGSDGSKAGMVFYDTELGVICSPIALTEGGPPYCVPAATLYESQFFSDSNCSTRLGYELEGAGLVNTDVYHLGRTAPFAADAGYWYLQTHARLSDGSWVKLTGVAETEAASSYRKISDGGCNETNFTVEYFSASSAQPSPNPLMEMPLVIE